MLSQWQVFSFCAAQAAIVPIAVLGNAAPDGNGRLNNFGRPGINNAGQVGFTSGNFDTAGSGDELAMNLRSVTGGPILQIARANQTVPGGNGKFSSFSFASSGFNDPPALNDSGAFAFHTLLTQTTNGPLDDRAIYFGSGGPLSLVVRGGQPLPEGNGNFYRFDSFTMNSVGQVAFSATVEPITGGTAADTGLDPTATSPSPPAPSRSCARASGAAGEWRPHCGDA